MRELFGDERLRILKQYKKEILIRFLIASAIYLFGVALVFIFKTREAMYLLPIILGIWTMFYSGYLFYFIFMYVRNYRGNLHFIKKINNSDQDFKEYHAKAIDVDSIVYNMYGVFCHGVKFLDLDTKKEFSIFLPMENLSEFSENGVYHLKTYLSVLVSYEEVK